MVLRDHLFDSRQAILPVRKLQQSDFVGIASDMTGISKMIGNGGGVQSLERVAVRFQE